MAVLHSIPVDEPTEGHTESRKCKCGPDVQKIGDAKYVYHTYMNNKKKVGERDG